MAVNQSEKPKKPYPDFPLYPHRSGQWAKKIRGHTYYFGPWDDPQGSLQQYIEERDDLQAGRIPRKKGEGPDVREMVNRFLTSKKTMLENGELARRSFQNYYRTCNHVVDYFGKNRLLTDIFATDFEGFRTELSKGRGPAALGSEIRQTRMIFKYAYEIGLLEHPVRFGATFKSLPRKHFAKFDKLNLLACSKQRNFVRFSTMLICP